LAAHSPDKDSIETGLHLAMQKFGSKLTLSGPREFKAKTAMMAANTHTKRRYAAGG
jgi:Large polyvalent protein-associated domain 7